MGELRDATKAIQDPPYVQCPDHWHDCNAARLVATMLTDPAPFDEAWLREVAGFTEPGMWIRSIRRGKITATYGVCETPGFTVSTDDGDFVEIHLEPQTRGDVWTLIERVEREPKNA